jgi:hypothetical protein
MNWTTFITVLVMLLVMYNIAVVYMYFRPEISNFFFKKETPKAPVEKPMVKESRKFVGTIKGDQESMGESNKKIDPAPTSVPSPELVKGESIADADNGHTVDAISSDMEIERTNMAGANIAPPRMTAFRCIVSRPGNSIKVAIKNEDSTFYEKEIIHDNSVHVLD